MKGLSLLIYTIFFAIIFLVDHSAFMAISGTLRGLPAQVGAITTQISQDISTRSRVNPPPNMEVFISDCYLPSHSSLDADDILAAMGGCENALGVVCVFHDYYDYRYRVCKGLRYKPVKTYYFDGRESPVLTVTRSLEDRTIELTRITS